MSFLGSGYEDFYSEGIARNPLLVILQGSQPEPHHLLKSCLLTPLQSQMLLQLHYNQSLAGQGFTSYYHSQ